MNEEPIARYSFLPWVRQHDFEHPQEGQTAWMGKFQDKGQLNSEQGVCAPDDTGHGAEDETSFLRRKYLAEIADNTVNVGYGIGGEENVIKGIGFDALF